MTIESDGGDVVVKSPDGDPLLVVGRDRSTTDRSRLVRLDLADRTLLMGARYALAVAESLTRNATEILREEKLVAAPSPSQAIH